MRPILVGIVRIHQNKGGVAGCGRQNAPLNLSLGGFMKDHFANSQVVEDDWYNTDGDAKAWFFPIKESANKSLNTDT